MIKETIKALSDLQSDLNYHMANGDLPLNLRIELGKICGKVDSLLENEEANG